MKKIVCYGNPVFDTIMTPLIKRPERVLSGCSTNACLAANYLGENCTLIGTVGQDFQQVLESELSARGIQYKLYPSRETGGFSLNYYDDQGNRTLDILGIAEDIPTDAEVPDDSDFVLIGPILNEISYDLVANIKNKSSAPILTDPQGLLRFAKNKAIVHENNENFKKVAQISTIVKANELETYTITGLDGRKEPEKAVKALYEYGCEIAVVTLAEVGSVIFDGKHVYKIPPFRVNAVDPTGAGDTYAAGFMVQYTETPDDLIRVGCFASSVASVMVENSGPIFPLTRKEADRRMNILLAEAKII